MFYATEEKDNKTRSFLNQTFYLVQDYS